MIYFMKLTQYGIARVADAMSGGAPVELTHIAVGDGNGQSVPTATGAETELVREVRRSQIAAMYKDPADATTFMVEMTIPSDVGGWSIRELGVFDASGNLFAYAKFPDTYKPIAAEGTTRDMRIIGVVKVASTAVINLVIDAAVVLASRAWVLSTITAGYLLPGGLTGQLPAKASNADGDIEWIDVTEGIQVLVDVVQEDQILATDQTVVNFSTVNTNGLAVYIDGARLLLGTDYAVTGETQITLAQSYPADSVLHAYQNDPLEAPEYLRPGLNLSDVPNKQAALENLGAGGKSYNYFMGQS